MSDVDYIRLDVREVDTGNYLPRRCPTVPGGVLKFDDNGNPSIELPESGGDGASAVISVKSFGAIGDGVTDDTAAIQAAATAIAASGGTLLFDDGATYLHRAEITFANTSGFIIEGNGSTLKSANGTTVASGFGGLRLTNCSNFTVRNLTIDGNRANRTPAEVPAHSLPIRSCSDFLLSQVRCINGVCDGIYMDNSTPASLTTACRRGRIEGAYCDNNYRQGMSVISGIGIQVSGSSFVNTNGTAPQCGVDLEPDVGHADGSVSNVGFHECNFTGNAGFGLSTATIGKPFDITIESCFFSSDNQGAINVGSRDVRILNCVFDGFASSSRGIVDVNANSWNEGCIVRGCLFRNITAPFAAFYVHGVSGGKATFENNRLESFHAGVNSNASFVNIRGNRFRNSVAYGISVTDGPYTTIVNNQFDTIQSYSVYLSANSINSQVINNRFLNCKNTGTAGKETVIVWPNNTAVVANQLILDVPDVVSTGIYILGNDPIYHSNYISGYTPTLSLKVTGTTANGNFGSGIKAPTYDGTSATLVDATLSGNLQAKNAGVGIAPIPSVGLYLRSNTLVGVAQIQAQASPTFLSDAVTSGTSLYVGRATEATSFTMGECRGVYIPPPVLGASSLVTNSKGIRIGNQGGNSNITNAFGIDIEAQSGAATINYGLRNAGLTRLTETTDSTGTSSGSLVVSGGVGIAKALVVGTTITALGSVLVPADSYDAATWNGNLSVPTKDAIRDKIESMVSAAGDTMFVRTGADQTTTSATAVDVTGMVFSIPAGETWSFEMYLTLSVSAAGANIKFAFTIPSGGTIGAQVRGSSSAAIVTAAGTLTSGVMSSSTGSVIIAGVATGGTGGPVQLQFASGDGAATARVTSAATYYKARKVNVS